LGKERQSLRHFSRRQEKGTLLPEKGHLPKLGGPAPPPWPPVPTPLNREQLCISLYVVTYPGSRNTFVQQPLATKTCNRASPLLSVYMEKFPSLY
jgi:hypothetical protein